MRAQLRRAIPTHILFTTEVMKSVFQIELFHEQLPLPVPCYDLVPVTELTLGPAYADTSDTPGSLDLTGECDFWNISRFHVVCGFPALRESDSFLVHLRFE